MALENCILRVSGGRWKVRTALTLSAALSEIAHARVTGSVGGMTIIDSVAVGGDKKTVADVVQVNSDNTERKPYSMGY